MLLTDNRLVIIVVSMLRLLTVRLDDRRLVWCGGNSVGLINDIQLRQARLVLGLVTCGGSTLPIFIHATEAHLSRPSPVSIGANSNGDGFATAGKETASSE